jgi:hypothetical protein
MLILMPISRCEHRSAVGQLVHLKVGCQKVFWFLFSLGENSKGRKAVVCSTVYQQCCMQLWQGIGIYFGVIEYVSASRSTFAFFSVCVCVFLEKFLLLEAQCPRCFDAISRCIASSVERGFCRVPCTKRPYGKPF